MGSPTVCLEHARGCLKGGRPSAPGHPSTVQTSARPGSAGVATLAGTASSFVEVICVSSSDSSNAQQSGNASQQDGSRLFLAVGALLYSLVMFQAAKGSAILMTYVFGGLPWLCAATCCRCCRGCCCGDRPKDRAGCVSFPYNKDIDVGLFGCCYGCCYGVWRRFFEFN